ncbi:MAG: M24 family metallopeptidase [Burkholderiales bacterium]|nr:M24 family metallopeptidase [Burkholderiales bacterium]
MSERPAAAPAECSRAADAFAALPPLPPRLRAILDQEYPRFPAGELRRRHACLLERADAAGADAVLVCGENRSGTGVGWLTGWPVTAEAVALPDRAGGGTLFVQHHNHVPLARRLAAGWDVRWGGPATVEAVAAELAARGARRVGVTGPWAARKHSQLAERWELVDLNADYTALRLVKSPDEIDWIRIGAWLTDRAVGALAAELRSGLTERDLWRICESAYVGEGGATWIHYFGVTPMAAPDCCVPAQYPSARPIEPGDAVLFEISAQFWEYPGQALRTFAVEAAPAPLYRALHAAAEAAFDAVLAQIRPGATMQSIVDAARVIEAAGFSTCDDLVHGFVGGYLPPVLGSRSRPAGPLPEMALAAGMTLVVQPNVVTPDLRAGVQVGELVLVTDAGAERLHALPRGLFVAGPPGAA